ncbi:CDP-alcohol phosphatidyltransferase family protein [Streptacidiphilus cavernicola]|uniref:CDP-alcohol phosphatidyltransferase family protein n=1 Tax=Streptacidiphilus cavernicola TaxID=3342716 RepID=A0ABV6VWV8_9ACTN
MVSAPALAELREVCQPQAKLRSRNGEHWAGRLYMRRISLHTTRQLVRTRVTPDALTWTMVVCGMAAGVALLIPGLAGALLAAVLFQLFLLFDCVDGEVARWKGQNSATGIYVDRLGAYLADAALLVDVARARRGLPVADDEASRPRSTGIASVRRLASVLKIHRITNGIEASLLLAAAVVDTAVDGHRPTQLAVLAVAAVTWVMVVAHLTSILSSSRLR